VTDTLQRPAAIDRSVPAILEAAEIVIARLGLEQLSLAQIARVSLIPLARIYQYFADRNAVLGALSARELNRLSGSIGTRAAWSGAMDADERVDHVIERFAGFLDNTSAAYLVLCGPFDEASTEPRLDAVHRLGLALYNALGGAGSDDHPYRTGESLDYAAELVFACFRRSLQLDGRITPTAVHMAQHAARSFVADPATK
jgi:AcrR family transcriptional regulator